MRRRRWALDIRLVAIDVDGTLVGEDDWIPPENVAAVRNALAAGIRVVLATGRAYEGVRSIIKQLGLTDPLVLLGGSIVQTASGDILKSYPMPVAQVKAVYDFCRLHGLSVRAQSPYGSYFLLTTPEHPDMEIILRRLREWAPYDYGFTHDYARLPVRGINKVTIVFDTVEQMRRLRPEMCATLRCMTHVQAFKNWIEITSEGTTKLRGIKYVARMMGIKRQSIAAIGDNENDLELVKWVGFGIFAGSAADDLKPAARVVTPAGEHAVAWGLSHLAAI